MYHFSTASLLIKTSGERRPWKRPPFFGITMYFHLVLSHCLKLAIFGHTYQHGILFTVICEYPVCLGPAPVIWKNLAM